ncbi:hypothetical protein JCM5353_004417 [Sporobolomyces roseus]
MGDSKDHKSSRREEKDRSRSPRQDRSNSTSNRHHSSHSSSNRDRDRDRSRSPRRDRDRDSRRSRRKEKERESESESEQENTLPKGVNQIGLDDFYIKATELKLWLWEEKGKKLDSLKNEDARRYFKKFCRSWNRGRLTDNFYSGISPASLPSSISTSHSWSFSKASQRDLDAAASIRKSIDTGTKERSYDSNIGPSRGGGSSSSSGGVKLGPSMPPSSAVERLQIERESLDQARIEERSYKDSQRKKSNREARDEEKDSRATGKDRLIEKRREGNMSRKEFAAEREGVGMVEVSEEVLMGGGGGGFADALKERERAKLRWEEKRGGQREEQKAVISDKLSAFKQKEDATMAQFRALAAQRFGPAPQ